MNEMLYKWEMRSFFQSVMELTHVDATRPRYKAQRQTGRDSNARHVTDSPHLTTNGLLFACCGHKSSFLRTVVMW